jgi:hypothetical protein
VSLSSIIVAVNVQTLRLLELRLPLLGFDHQQVEVLGHDNIAPDHKIVTPPYLLQNGKKKITAPGRSQKGLAVIVSSQ